MTVKNKLLRKKIKEDDATFKAIAATIGISVQQIYRYIDGEDIPGVHIANSLAKYFGMGTNELFTNLYEKKVK